MDRRTVLQLLAATTMTNPLTAFAQASGFKLTGDDEAFLDDMERRACLYFVEQASPITGQVLDRARADNTTGKLDPRHMASVSATGFGLTALCIADSRGYFPRQQILDQVRRTLRWHADVFANDHGLQHRQAVSGQRDIFDRFGDFLLRGADGSGVFSSRC
jgi:hypothetical protein